MPRAQARMHNHCFHKPKLVAYLQFTMFLLQYPTMSYTIICKKKVETLKDFANKIKGSY